jgi:hypothetical protein
LQSLLGTGLSDYAQSEHTNFLAGNGVNVTTNDWWFEQQGTRLELFQEEGTGFANHYMFKLTDYLALGAMLQKLSPALGFGQLDGLIKAGSYDMKASYEGVLDAVRRMVLGASVTATPAVEAANDNAWGYAAWAA